MLQKIQILPGFNKQVTATGGEGQWVSGDYVRFRYNSPEKIGGWSQLGDSTLTGRTVAMHQFVNASGIKYSWPGEKTRPPWLTKFSPIRFNKYEVGNTMRIHYDNIHSIFDGKMKGIPIVSIVGNLNEDYEGAEFMLRDKEIKLKTGDILLFPSGIVYPHTVKETKKGIRYSFVSWAF